MLPGKQDGEVSEGEHIPHFSSPNLEYLIDNPCKRIILGNYMKSTDAFQFNNHSIRISPVIGTRENSNTNELYGMAYFALSGGTSLNHSKSMLPWSLTTRFRNSCKHFAAVSVNDVLTYPLTHNALNKHEVV